MSSTFEPGEQWDKDRIICPYCGHSRKAEPCDGDANQEPTDDECGECGKEFIRSAYVEITYRTNQKEKP